ncbi:hypothetical protein [Piscinibacter sp.]|uniref:hypothetical protein n=1 Tax=Piscinibacter sp. TaxID=1903157 RepID=UPI002ECFC412
MLKQLVRGMGIAVAGLRDVSEQLFAVCRGTAWPQLADKALAIDVVQGEVRLWGPEDEIDAPVILLPMRPLAEQLQAAWADTHPSFEQLSLIPPALVTTGGRRAAR